MKSHECNALCHFCRDINSSQPLRHDESYRPPGKEMAQRGPFFYDIFLRSLVDRVLHPYLSPLPQSGSGHHQCTGAVISLNCTFVAPYYERQCECCQSSFGAGNGTTGQKTSLASINYQAPCKRELTDETGISMNEQYSSHSKTADWVLSLPA